MDWMAAIYDVAETHLVFAADSQGNAQG